MSGAIRALAHLDSVTVSIFRVPAPVIAVAVPHGIAVLQNHREFLVDKIETVVTVPPGTTPNELGGIAFARLLVMRTETVRIFAIALPTRRVVIVVGIAIQKNVPAAICSTVVRKEPRARIVVAIHLF